MTLHYVCRDEDGNLIDASREHKEPVLSLTDLITRRTEACCGCTRLCA